MDSLLQMRRAVQSDLNVDDTSTLYDPDTIDLALNRAHRKIGGLFRWPETEDAKKTSTEVNQEYYDYPQNWRPDSIWKLKVDGEDYGDPIAYKDYLYEQENDNPSGLTKMWSNQWRRFFIDPTPTANGNNNICLWGQKVVDAMEADEDTTIFSYSMPEVNEAIVMEAVAILSKKGNDSEGGMLSSQEAKEICLIAWNKIRQEQAKYEKTTSFFETPDFFSSKGKRSTRIGDF